MTTSIQAATEETAAAAPMAQANMVKRMPAMAAPAQGGAAMAGVNPQDFVNANRIHVKDGSLFVDGYLALHPRELAPENEAALRQKLQLTYSINNPSFFESGKRMAVALNLGQLMPVSPDAKRSQLLEEVNKFNTQLETGQDADLQKDLERKNAPFASIVKSITDQPKSDPVGLEVLKNGLSVYLLVREKLTQLGYLEPLDSYVVRAGTTDQVLADLASKIGVSPLAMREAALKGGLEGVGQLLGLDARYVADVKQLADYAATQDFSYNLVEHWHLGRQLQGIAAPLQEKLAVGMDARITAKIAEFRNKVHHQFEVPKPIQQEQNRIAESLKLVDPVQRALLFKLGYELCYTPEVNADAIAFYNNIYGLHRKAANNLQDVRGTYRIYFSGHGDLEASMRTMVHEIAHNLWPAQFTPEDVKTIDANAASDAKRFANFQKLMTEHYPEFEKLFNAYKAGNAEEKAAVIAATNQQFAAYGFNAEGLFPYLREAHDFQFAVKHANDTLCIEGDRYNRSGYNSPEERFREVISRFAELKQVKYRGEPQFLQFLAPGLNQVWEKQYLPHLSRVLNGLEHGAGDATKALAQAAVDGDVESQPKLREDEKVKEQPAAPTHKETAEACVLDSTPSPRVDANSITMTPRSLAAMNALSGMGVSPQF